MRRLFVVPALALAVIAAVTAAKSPGRVGDRRTPVGGRVSVVLPAGWHLTYQAQIYLGPAAPAAAPAQIAAILDSWRVTPTRT